MANVLNSLFGGGKASPDPVKVQAGDSGKLYFDEFQARSAGNRWRNA